MVKTVGSAGVAQAPKRQPIFSSFKSYCVYIAWNCIRREMVRQSRRPSRTRMVSKAAIAAAPTNRTHFPLVQTWIVTWRLRCLVLVRSNLRYFVSNSNLTRKNTNVHVRLPRRAPRGRKIEISGRQRWLSRWRVQSTWKKHTSFPGLIWVVTSGLFHLNHASFVRPRKEGRTDL